MAADPFNSKGGYTIGIPPIPILDSNGNLTVPEAVIGNVLIEGDQVVSGTLTSNLFIGSFQGNIVCDKPLWAYWTKFLCTLMEQRLYALKQRPLCNSKMICVSFLSTVGLRFSLLEGVAA